MSRRRSNSMEIDDQHEESDASNNENLSQVSTVVMSPDPKQRKSGNSTTDDSVFKQPATVPATRARASRSQTRQNRKNYRESSESGEDTERSPSPVPRNRGNGSRRSRKSQHAHNPENRGRLFNMMKEEAELSAIASDWIEKYKENREETVALLLEFLVNSSGNESKITPEMLRSMEIKEVADKIIADSDDNIENCPLIGTNARRREFPHNFVNFIEMIICKCGNSILHDDYLLQTLQDLITDLSVSKLRVLRHTATLAALKIVTALIEVVLALSPKFHKIEGQLNAANSKETDVIRTLRLNHDELKAKLTEIYNTMSSFLESVFCCRSKDTIPDIRSMCIEEYGMWAHKLPKLFLIDKYLDPIGFSLFDNVAAMRLKSLKMLQSLYSSEQLNASLVAFNENFKDRMLAMALDKDIKVAVECIKLITIIQGNHRDLLTDLEFDNIYELLFAEDRSLAVSAGHFFIEIMSPEDGAPILRTARGKKRSLNTKIIRDLVRLFMDAELPDHADYLVDALIDNEMMQDWGCMTDLLLEELGPEEEDFPVNQQMSLMELMLSCIKQTATGQPPHGRKKKALSEKDQKRIAVAKRKLTTHFMRTLPPLLQKYRDNSDLLGMLLTIPQNFSLSLFVQDYERLQFLLDEIKEIVDDTSDEKVIHNSSSTLQYFCDQLFPGRAQCQAARDIIIDSLNQRFRRARDDYTTLTTSGETTDQEALDKVVISLRKIAIFYANHNLNRYNLWDLLWEVVKSGMDQSTNFSSEDIVYSLEACYFSLIWGKHALSDAGERGEAIAASLNENLENFMNTLKYFLDAEDNNHLHIIREKAYSIITDLLIIFQNLRGIDPNPLIYETVYEPDPELWDMLRKFLQDHVFIEENPDNSEYHDKRRHFLMAFCRLIMENVLPVELTVDIFKNYANYYDVYGDIIKMTLTRVRELNRNTWALAMHLSLIQLFNEIFEEKNGNIGYDDMKSVKELAKSYRLFFGLDTQRGEGISIIHLGGINFIATASKDSNGIPTKLLYFDVLVEFSSKLVTGHKNRVLEFVDRKLPIHWSSQGSEWGPLMRYRQSLGSGSWNATEDAGKRTRSEPRVTEETERDWSDASTEYDPSTKYDSTSEPMDQDKNESSGSKKKKKTLKQTPASETRTRKAPKASTPAETTTPSESFHTVSQKVQTQLDGMNIDLSHERTQSSSQASGAGSYMETDFSG